MALSSLSSAGFTYSDYPTTLEYVKNIFRTIYGSDIYLEADSQDGQLCAAFATAMYDNNQTFAAVIQTLSPTYAQGAQLSNEVLINGISRKPATASTVSLTLTGDVGTYIINASAKDSNGNIWDIASGTIGGSGILILDATCRTTGAIAATPNTITIINTPILGWNTVTNPLAATTGQDEESDYDLRQRQKVSTSLPAQSTISGLYAGLKSLLDVGRVKVYENPTGTTDSNGLPPHSVSATVEGGIGQLIANEIALRKTIGCATYGSSTYTVTDSEGVSISINYNPLTFVNVGMSISIHPLAGYVSTTATEIKLSLQSYIDSLPIGDDILYTRLFTYANLNGNSLGESYNITAMTIGVLSTTYGTSDIVIPFNKAAKIALTDITITIV